MVACLAVAKRGGGGREARKQQFLSPPIPLLFPLPLSTWWTRTAAITSISMLKCYKLIKKVTEIKQHITLLTRRIINEFNVSQLISLKDHGVRRGLRPNDSENEKKVDFPREV